MRDLNLPTSPASPRQPQNYTYPLIGNQAVRNHEKFISLLGLSSHTLDMHGCIQISFLFNSLRSSSHTETVRKNSN